MMIQIKSDGVKYGFWFVVDFNLMSMMMVTMIWILIDAIAGAVARRGDLPILDQGRPLLSSPLKNLDNHLKLTSSS